MLRFLRLVAIVFFVLMIFMLLMNVANANAHWKPGTHNATHAILLAFCGNPNYTCYYGIQAVRVAKCESSWYWWRGRPQEATNGQYRGMFQMGTHERGVYGDGRDPWKQAFAAHRYFLLSGRDWSPWECKPW